MEAHRSLIYNSVAGTILALLQLPRIRAQTVNVPIPIFGDGTKGRWYVWVIVSIAGVFLIYTSFFVVRGFLVARRRRLALEAAGLSEEDPIYGTQHKKVLESLVDKNKRPQGKSFAPMTDSLAPPAGAFGDEKLQTQQV